MLTKKLIQETKKLIQWYIFLKYEVGVKYDFRAQDLRKIALPRLQVEKSLPR